AVAIGRPARTLHIAIESAREEAGLTAIAVHNVELAYLVALVLVVEADVGDVPAIWREDGVVVRALAAGQRLNGSIGNRELKDLGVEGLMFVILVAVGREDQVLAVG